MLAFHVGDLIAAVTVGPVFTTDCDSAVSSELVT